MTVDPPDDAGARTADQYEWQAAMAAADGLRMYFDQIGPDGQLAVDHNCRILCERHEDWVAMKGDDAELVSAKHYGLSFGAYTTMNKLANDGGLAHLFDRWHAMQEKASCRLVTTVGVDGPPRSLVLISENLRKLRMAGQVLSVDTEAREHLQAFSKALRKHCDGLEKRWHPNAGQPAGSVPTEGQLEEVMRFLSMFSYQESVQRQYAAYAAPGMYVQPVLDKVGSTVSAAAVWGAVLSLFRARMRAAGPTPPAGLPAVLATGPSATSPAPADQERDLLERIVTLNDIHVTIRTAIRFPDGFAPLPRLVRTTRLAVKMEVGQCSDNAVERAEQLRLDFQDWAREQSAANPMARIEHASLMRFLMRVSDEATSTVKVPNAVWGAGFWREVERLLEKKQTSLPQDMDVDLALGGLCELSNRCRVWFSPSFDIEAELARRRPRGGESQ